MRLFPGEGPGGRCEPGPQGLPASPTLHISPGNHARHLALAVGSHREVTLRWSGQLFNGQGNRDVALPW